jgi:membrane-associated phospholipid phosphatase
LANLAEDERPDALPEILAQDGLYANFLADFTGLLGISPASHPKTTTLLHVGGIVGLFIDIQLKTRPAGDVPARPRPSQCRPALKPSVAVPGHASYPSGHATQAMLMALCVSGSLPKPFLGSDMAKLLCVLARRIARNREIAGLHYRSDSEAGYSAAEQAYALLAAIPAFNDLRYQAALEWNEYGDRLRT